MVGQGNCLRGYPLVGLPTPGDGTDPDFPEGMTGSLKSLPRGIRIENAISSYCAARAVDEVEAALNELGIPNQKAFALIGSFLGFESLIQKTTPTFVGECCFLRRRWDSTCSAEQAASRL